ncbi:MAG: HutD family protein [Ruminococcaceae bacterium]|nr:HutD family protein [Oscillospiraceae bacterium]
MTITLIPREGATVGVWSGGTTTELALYPPDGSYAQRRFLFRISSADVQLEESTFTPLPGVTRYITPLTGGFTLTHPDGSSVVMEPLDTPYRFDGGVPTVSRGRAADFNLMCKGCGGVMTLAEGTDLALPGFNYYMLPAGGEVTAGGFTYRLRPLDLLLIETDRSVPVRTDKALVCRIDL